MNSSKPTPQNPGHIKVSSKLWADPAGDPAPESMSELPQGITGISTHLFAAKATQWGPRLPT
jgi:hypothetical protein